MGKAIRKALLAVGLLALMAGLLRHSGPVGEAVRQGIALCGRSVIPSLFPFFVTVSFAVACGFFSLLRQLRLPLNAAVFLLGVVGGYVVALCAGMVDFSGFAGSSLLTGENAVLGLQPFLKNFSGSVAKFDLTAILVMAPIAVASMMEHIGDVSAISATVGENFIEDPGLHRTLIGDGVATALAGLFGGPANTTYGENTGVLVLSRVHDPRVVRLAAIYAIILSFSPAFAHLVNTIPSAIIGGVSFILYGMISAIGVRNVVENHVDFTNSRNLIIAAVILVCGLGFTDGLTFQIGAASITLTSLAIAAIAGIVLNAILPGNDFYLGKSASGDDAGSLGKY